MELRDWLTELDLANRMEKNWRTNATEVVKRYRDERNRDSKSSQTYQFNILYSNVETLRPAFFSQNPEPVVNAVYADDPEASYMAKVLKKCLKELMDDADYYGFGTSVVTDYLLPGRSTARIEYCPDIRDVSKEISLEQRDGEFYKGGSDEPVPYESITFKDGAPYLFESADEIVDETIKFRRWPWADYRQQYKRHFDDVEWIAFRRFLNEKELKKNFKSKASEIPQLYGPDGNSEQEKDGDKCTHAEIWEVYSKNERKLYIGCEGMDDWITTHDDPTLVRNFFPTPEPLLNIKTEDSLVPIPEYTIYQDQASELDKVTHRLAMLQDALKAVGFYAGSAGDLMTQLQSASELTLIPVDDWAAMQGSGGIDGKISWLPVEHFAKVMISLSQTRDRLIQTIFEITGISDIMRGSTDPRETRGAQSLKAQFGSRRLSVRQAVVQRYLRDCLRIASEMIGEHFSAETVSKLSGMQVTDEQMQLLRDDGIRNYRIDIETDSTIAPDEEREKQQIVEAIGALGQFLATVAPLVQSGQLTPGLAAELLKRSLRPFRFGAEIEELLDQAAQAAQQQGGQPRDPEKEAKAQAISQEMQIKQAEAQLKAQESQAKMQMEQQKFQQEQARKDREAEQKIRLEQAEYEREQARKDALAQAQAAAVREKAKQKPESKSDGA